MNGWWLSLEISLGLQPARSVFSSHPVPCATWRNSQAVSLGVRHPCPSRCLAQFLTQKKDSLRSQWGSGCVHCPWFRQYCTGFPTIWKPGSQNRLTLEPGFKSTDAVRRWGTDPSKGGQSKGREHRCRTGQQHISSAIKSRGPNPILYQHRRASLLRLEQVTTDPGHHQK